jgi:hypothetical protein
MEKTPIEEILQAASVACAKICSVSFYGTVVAAPHKAL